MIHMQTSWKIVDIMCRAANDILCSCCELPDTTPLQACDIGPIDLSICGRNLLSVPSSPRNQYIHNQLEM